MTEVLKPEEKIARIIAPNALEEAVKKAIKAQAVCLPVPDLREGDDLLEITGPIDDLAVDAISRAILALPEIVKMQEGDYCPAIMRQIYIALERQNAPFDLLAVVGSFRDTLKDEEVLQMLTDFNETGAVIQPRVKPQLSLVDTAVLQPLKKEDE